LEIIQERNKKEKEENEQEFERSKIKE